MLNTKMIRENGDLLVVLEGKIDTITAPEFDSELEAEIKEGVKSITIDAEKLEYISSAGLRCLLATQQYMEENDLDNIKVIKASEDIKEIFRITGIDKMLDVE